MTIRDLTFMSIANILYHYNRPDSEYNISVDMGNVLEYISHLESQIERRKEHENN